MRVTQKIIYGNVVNYTNSALSDLIETNIQSSSQKRINKPSDDPIGMVQVIDHRTALSALSQYQTNIDQATGWLNLADQTMVQVNTVLTRCKELAQKGTTGTLTDENRDQISFEVRQLFEELVSLSNTEYDNKSLFAGQKTDKNAFVESLWLTSNDSSLDNRSFDIQGDTDSTALIQFTGTEGDKHELVAGDTFRYSFDGGTTWATGTVTDPGGDTLSLQVGGGLQVNIERGTSVTDNSATDTNDANGTWMWVRPTAIYQGDDKDGVDVDPLQDTDVLGEAAGAFDENVIVRIDETQTLDNPIAYSYSTDGGVSWITQNQSTPDASNTSANLVVPGGILTLSNAGSNTVNAGDEFVIRPRMADINVDITPNESITINGVGKDIFGGVYTDPSSDSASAVTINGSIGANVFETVGKLVGYLETNNQDGIQESLENLTEASATILNYAANVGGRENRLETSQLVLQNLTLNEEDALSAVEDADLTQLMTKLAQQELAYSAVLKSSSKLMSMSLINYI
ncbi:flagellar hook-associated protein FlgL [Desulfovibrio inopinatus]|uniref:flagellar hook-associated protein FlgL n=1 Tax=Desulfovibrio inopinatus TaxID=102109 RepID=UPI0004217B8A|nr:flagellar hook-associated protein FlgL [Desulfovibrio inopinatus]